MSFIFRDDVGMKHYSLTVPVVWEDTHRVRFGVDVALVRLKIRSRSEAHLIHLLRRGVTHDELQTRATSLGIQEDILRTFMTRLAPVVTVTHLSGPEHVSFPAVLVDDGFALGDAIYRALTHTAFPVSRGGMPRRGETPIVITVDRYAYDTTRLAQLSARGSVVLPVRLTDRTATLGPFITDTGVCGGCLHAHDVEGAASWLAWPEQLVAKPVPVENTGFAGICASLVIACLQQREILIEANTQLRITCSPNGLIDSVQPVTGSTHPECTLHTASDDLLVA